MAKINNMRLHIQNIVCFIIILASDFINPFERTFSLYDKSIANPQKQEMVSFVTVLLVSYIIPMIIFFIYFRYNSRYKRFESTFYSYFTSAHLFVILITCILKIIVGRLRPDFLDRCQYENGICTGLYRNVKEGRKSFPSGHTSTMFCGIVWMIIYTSRVVKNKIFAIIIQILLAKTAVFVGWSRVYDFRHFISDVVFGFFIGTISSVCFVILMKKKLKQDYFQRSTINKQNK